MDLYIFYNCINKIINIIEISEHELNNTHVDFVNNPLTLVNQNTSPNHNLIGGAAAIAKLGPTLLKNKNTIKKGIDALKKGNLDASKLQDLQSSIPGNLKGKLPMGKFQGSIPGNSKLQGLKSKMTQMTQVQEQTPKEEAAPEGKSNSDFVSEGFDDEAEDSETANLKKTLKLMLKICLYFLIILLLPLVPWIYISFIAFKKLYSFLELNVKKL